MSGNTGSRSRRRRKRLQGETSASADAKQTGETPDESDDAPTGGGRRRRWIAFGLVVVALAVGVGLWRPWERGHDSGSLSGRAEGFNVLLITMDTTRADCLGCYGYRGIETPNIGAVG